MMRHILCEILGKHVNIKTVGKFTFSKAVISNPLSCAIDIFHGYSKDFKLD